MKNFLLLFAIILPLGCSQSNPPSTESDAGHSDGVPDSELGDRGTIGGVCEEREGSGLLTVAGEDGILETPATASWVTAFSGGPPDPETPPLEIIEHQLFVNLRWGGGCVSHAFSMHWDGAFVGESGSEVALELTDPAAECPDSCAAIIGFQPRFSLESIRERYIAATGERSGSLTIRVNDLDPVVYSFEDVTLCSNPMDGAASTQSGGLRQSASPTRFGRGFESAEVTSPTISEDLLSVDVSYDGGCHERTVTAYWAGTLFGVARDASNLLFTLSSPCAESCDASITATLSYDLSPLKDAYREATGSETGAIRLTLGSGSSIVYAF